VASTCCSDSTENVETNVVLRMLNALLGQNQEDQLTRAELELLKTVRPDVIADPALLRIEVRRVQQRRAEAQLEWERLDLQGDPRACLRQPELAKQMLSLSQREDDLTSAITEATRRRKAFLKIAAHFEVVDRNVNQLLSDALEHPPTDDGKRERVYRLLDEASRLRIRVAWHLQAVSTARQFREPPDALKVLRNDYEERLRRLDRMRMPGTRSRFIPPPAVAALLTELQTPTSASPTAKETTTYASR
jgi:hypothetical protein